MLDATICHLLVITTSFVASNILFKLFFIILYHGKSFEFASTSFTLRFLSPDNHLLSFEAFSSLVLSDVYFLVYVVIECQSLFIFHKFYLNASKSYPCFHLSQYSACKLSPVSFHLPVKLSSSLQTLLAEIVINYVNLRLTITVP